MYVPDAGTWYVRGTLQVLAHLNCCLLERIGLALTQTSLNTFLCAGHESSRRSFLEASRILSRTSGECSWCCRTRGECLLVSAHESS